MDDHMEVLEALATHVSGPDARRLAEGLPEQYALPLLRASEMAGPGDFYAATAVEMVVGGKAQLHVRFRVFGST